ncbi:hypothetical protein [Micromonospora sp. WMMD998]|uniref:hypothetical protein n=1 Tax=Micromonospora sp. WMMD998 TaxID=3016092 RepID=UPI00249A9AC6|nr:hypothetical protein [Micromonospora sp. WMMD998]WFE41911.1 hypothetical protein O7619_27085 [Micromonospora sp. WMMD998]
MSARVAPIDPTSPGGLAAAESLGQALGEIYAGIAARRAASRVTGPRPPAGPVTPPPPAGPATPSKQAA